MNGETVLMGKRKKIALVAHNNKKGNIPTTKFGIF